MRRALAAAAVACPILAAQAQNETRLDTTLNPPGADRHADFPLTLPSRRAPLDPNAMMPDPTSELESPLAQVIGRTLHAKAHDPGHPLNDLPNVPVPPDARPDSLKTPVPPVGRLIGPGWAGLACEPLVYRRGQVSDYWNRVAAGTLARASAPGSASNSSAGPAPDGAPPADPDGTPAGEWCGPRRHVGWFTEPFTVLFWGPLLILTLGTLLFWLARGFRRP